LLAAEDGDYRRYYEAVRDAIRWIGPNPVPPAQAVALMAVIAAGEQSAAEGRSVVVPLTEAEVAAFRAVGR
jgi:predicted dehydrogenase